VAVHDGFYGCGTGAGHSNRAFLRILTRLLAPDARLIAMPVMLTPASSEYDPAWHQETLRLLPPARSDVIPVDNGTTGLARFGGLTQFRAACVSAAASITRLARQHPHMLIIAFDAPFYGLAPLLPADLRASLVNVARATAAQHAPDDRERITWERDGLLATARAGGRVAATSRHMREHLAVSYRIPQPAIADLTNGLTRAEQHHPAGPELTPLPPAARHGFLLSFGRAEPYKGFDDLLDALHILATWRVKVPHTILGAVTDGPPLTPYQKHLARRITAEALDVTLLTVFSVGIRGLLRHPMLAAVVVPSRTEPFGRIPLDAFAAGASPVIATTAGGLAEIVTEGHTGYTANPADPASLAAAIHRALSSAPEQRERMLAEGRRITARRYDYDTNVQAFLTALAPWAVASPQST
jgi:glycosyltransferase involved in cell wall biosynthesis